MEKLKRKIDDMTAMTVTKGEVKKNVEVHVVEFRDIVQQQIQEEMHSVDGELNQVMRTIQFTKEEGRACAHPDICPLGQKPTWRLY